ncbi:hypothetical protein GWI33_020283 [Rhynchophorus ferrugineus]|uniref:Uncharacterized protein n=1 Tax=Rhynchophorus ferrugineus TaxID=354439 RepID=A0A834M624_RHYFE|nr:hypothetical protein GWI33_020283 [Rhynchophorus ferrugineus]
MIEKISRHQIILVTPSTISQLPAEKLAVPCHPRPHLRHFIDDSPPFPAATAIIIIIAATKTLCIRIIPKLEKAKAFRRRELSRPPGCGERCGIGRGEAWGDGRIVAAPHGVCEV